jgi:membrane-associated phospholipid phosphatase
MRRSALRWRVSLGVASAVVLPLAVLTRVGWHPLTRFDRRTDDDAHTLVVAHHWLLSLARALTHLGDPVVVTALAVVVAVGCFLAGHRRAAVYVLLVRAVAVVLGFGLKEAVRRARPVLAHPVAHANGFSFPSGHALGSAAAYASLALVLPRRVPMALRVALAVVVPMVVACTRVLLGVHFPSDVVAGLVLGWAVALLLAAVWVGTQDDGAATET